MQISYAELLKDLTGQYNSGRITFDQFRALRRSLLNDAQVQYSTPPEGGPGEEPEGEDVTVVQPR